MSPTIEERDAQYLENERINRRIKKCDHDPVNQGGMIFCHLCGCRFAVMLRPVPMKTTPISFDEDNA